MHRVLLSVSRARHPVGRSGSGYHLAPRRGLSSGALRQRRGSGVDPRRTDVPVTSGQPQKAVITGAGGQLGRALQTTVPATWQAVPLNSDSLDVTRLESVRAVLERERPTVVIQAAAYTNVDGAEQDAERAASVNITGAANVAAEASRLGIRLIHISSDFVFD